ncbi:MAG: hypothetical protein GX316_04430, partial [Firmicutes bacterium]|nr:hypothetical protein [Bacillota bacterium]
MDKQQFRNPANRYRSVPFWAWNDRLEPKRVREQIRHMHAIGLGGFFMHSRQGLDTAFLGPEWMDAVAAAVNEAGRLGMEAWIYDEDRYPSGAAGGLALKDNVAAFTAKHLCFHDSKHIPDTPGVLLGRFAYAKQADGSIESRHLSEGSGLRPGERCLTFYWENAKPSAWFNGYAYLDTLDKDAVRSFITHALEPYKKTFANHFGQEIPGVFTDEPQMYCERQRQTSTLPWTPRFPIEFKQRCGYDLLPNLADLVLDTEGSWQIRHDYWHTATNLFLENWCRPMANWCDQHGLLWTGHYWEHEFPYFYKAGSFMAPLAYLHVPGVDLLGRRTFIGKLPNDEIQSQMGNVQMIKLGSSVAHQMGRKRVLSETYGGAMSDLSFQDQKIMGDWQYALGVNLLNQHLYHYSLRGLRKRDYPPSWGRHQPWSSAYNYLADYFARLSYALTRGEFAADIAVLHPTTVFWVEGYQRQDIARAFEDLCKDLTEANWDYDLADEILMETLSEIRDKKLKIGQASYSLFILPSHTVLADSTLDILAKFLQSGGTVCYLGKPPKTVKKTAADKLANILPLMQSSPDFASLQKVLTAEIGRTVKIITDSDTGQDGSADGNTLRIYSHLRRQNNSLIVFLANVGETMHPLRKVSIKHKGPVYRLDLFNGDITPISYQMTEDGVVVGLSFLEAESHLLVLGDAKLGKQSDKSQTWKPVSIPAADSQVLPVDGWNIHPLCENSLVLDWCRYRIDGAKWSLPMPIWDAFTRIRQTYGFSTSRANRDIQPWRQKQSRSPITSSETIDIELSFNLHNVDECHQTVKLVVESGSDYIIDINGVQKPPYSGIWLDEAFATYDVTDFLKEGSNTVILSTTFNEFWELENCFLLGHFLAIPTTIAVPAEVDFHLDKLSFGDWTKQGYPFFAGQMEYRTVFRWDGS